MDIQDWSVTAASNTDIDGTDVDEGCEPANVNNAIRAVMANIAALRDLVGGAKVTAGTADAQTLTTGLSLAAYQQGLPLAFEAGATNTGAMTVNVDAIGAKAVKLVDGGDTPAGAVTAGGIYLLAYEANADVLLLLNPAPSAVGIGDVVDDATPQLGGDLDLNGSDITGTGNIDVTGDVTLTGAFTSAGIDDNATATNLDLGNTTAAWGQGTTAGFLHFVGSSDGLQRFSGGSSGNLGANFYAYGESHATAANDFLLARELAD